MHGVNGEWTPTCHTQTLRHDSCRQLTSSTDKLVVYCRRCAICLLVAIYLLVGGGVRMKEWPSQVRQAAIRGGPLSSPTRLPVLRRPEQVLRYSTPTPTHTRHQHSTLAVQHPITHLRHSTLAISPNNFHTPSTPWPTSTLL